MLYEIHRYNKIDFLVDAWFQLLLANNYKLNAIIWFQVIITSNNQNFK